MKKAFEQKTTCLQKDIDKKDFTHKEAKRAVRIWEVTHTEEGGYRDNDFTIHLFEDGAITISENDGDGFISLHGEIAQTFRKLICEDTAAQS